METSPGLLHLSALGGCQPSIHHAAVRDLFALVDHSGVGKAVTAAGQHCVMVGTDASQDTDCIFLDTNKKCKEVISVCTDQSGQLIAVCERLRDDTSSAGVTTDAASDFKAVRQAQISVYHAQTRECLRSLNYKHTNSHCQHFDFLQCCFSGDSAYVAAYGACHDGGEGMLFLFKWKSKKLIGYARLPSGVSLSRLRINPQSHLRSDGSQAPLSALHISASGCGYLRSWRPLGDGTLRETPMIHQRRELEEFVDHTWLRSTAGNAASGTRKGKERRLAALTATGLIYVVAKHETPGDAGLAESIRNPITSASAVAAADALVLTSAPSSGTNAEIWELKAVLQVRVPDELLHGVSAGLSFRVAPGAVKGAGTTQYGSEAGGKTAGVNSRHIRMNCIAATSRGFLVGGDRGFLGVFERSDTSNGSRIKARAAAAEAALAGVAGEASEEARVVNRLDDPFVMVKSATMRGDQNLQAIVLHNEDLLGMFSRQYGITTISVSSLDSLEDAEHKTDMETKLLFGGGMHVGKIAGLSGSVSQSLVASCSPDASVRVWNYMTSTCDVAHKLTDNAPAFPAEGLQAIEPVGSTKQTIGSDWEVLPLCVSMHSSGYLLAVGFREKFCMFNVCATGLSLWRPVPLKQVSVIRFSRGGAFLAAASGQHIHIYATYTLEHVHTLSAHVAGVRDISWSPDDNFLGSAGDDGAVFIWSMTTGKRVEEYCNVIRGVKFSAVHLVCLSLAAIAIESSTSESAAMGAGRTKEPSDIVKRRHSMSNSCNESVGLSGIKAIIGAGEGAEGVNVIYICQVPTGSITKLRVNSASITTLAMDPCNTKLFAGTSAGSLKVYAWPVQADASTIWKGSRRTSTTASVEQANPSGAPLRKPTLIASTKRMQHSVRPVGKEAAGDDTLAGAADIQEFDDLITSGATAGSFAEPPCTEYHLHVGCVTGIVLSADGRYLVTGGSDGVMFVLGIPYADNGRALSPRRAGRLPTMRSIARAPTLDTDDVDDATPMVAARETSRAEEVSLIPTTHWTWEPTPTKLLNAAVTLLPRTVYEDAMSKLAASEAALKEAKDDTLRSLARANSEFAAKLSTLNQQAEISITTERTKYEMLAARHESYIRESVAAREKAESDTARMLAETANRYERKLAAEMQRYDELQEEVLAVKQAAEEALSKAELERKAQVSALLASASKRQHDMEVVISKLKQALKEAEERHTAMLEDAEQENEDYVTRLTIKMEGAVVDEGKKATEKQSVITKMHKQISILTKQLRVLERELDVSRNDIAAKELKISQLQEQTKSLARQLEEQGLSMADKERDIGALRSDKRTLESFRFVLDHRLAELDSDRGPVAHHVARLEEHIRSVYEELVTKFHDSKGLDRSILALQDKLQTMSAELKKSRHVVSERARLLDNLMREIEKVAHGPDGDLRVGISHLMSKYFRSKEATIEVGTEPVFSSQIPMQEHRETVDEFVRQKEFMRRGAAALARQASSVTRVAGRKTAVAVAENLSLIDEANTLRQEVIFQRRQLNKLETDLSLRGSARDVLVAGKMPASPAEQRRHAVSGAVFPSLALSSESLLVKSVAARMKE